MRKKRSFLSRKVQIARTRVKLFAYLCQVLFTKQKEYELGSYSFFTLLSMADGFWAFFCAGQEKPFSAHLNAAEGGCGAGVFLQSIGF